MNCTFNENNCYNWLLLLNQLIDKDDECKSKLQYFLNVRRSSLYTTTYNNMNEYLWNLYCN